MQVSSANSQRISSGAGGHKRPSTSKTLSPADLDTAAADDYFEEVTPLSQRIRKKDNPVLNQVRNKSKLGLGIVA